MATCRWRSRPCAPAPSTSWKSRWTTSGCWKAWAARSPKAARPGGAAESKAAAELIGGLTMREREVLDRLVLGMSNKLVAHELGISPRTVETHRARLQAKLKARDLSYLVRLSIAAGQMH